MHCLMNKTGRHLGRAQKLVLTAVVVLQATTPVASAGTFGSEYARKGWCNGPIKDPIGSVFYGTGAQTYWLVGEWWRNSPRKGHLYFHTRWGLNLTTKYEDNQYHGAGPRGCVESNQNQPASSVGPGHDRFHMRLFYDYRTPWGQDAVLGTPHHEDWIKWPRCGWAGFPGNHAVDRGAVDREAKWRTRTGSGFDWGRRKLQMRMAKGNHYHSTDYVYWGNTSSVKQCDGDYAGGNGNVVWISLGR